MHFVARFVLRGGDGIQARRERAQQGNKLLGGELGGVVLCQRNGRIFGHQRGGVCLCTLCQLGVARQFGIAFDEVRRVLADFVIVREGCAQGLVLAVYINGLVACERNGGQQARDQFAVVVEPHAQRIARRVLQTRAGKVDFDVAHVFVGIAAGDFLAHGQGGGERVFFAVRAWFGTEAV